MTTIKERPGCRRAIEKLGLRPALVGGVWDYLTAFNEEGKRSSLSDGMLKEMKVMAAEGRWGEIPQKERVKNVR